MINLAFQPKSLFERGECAIEWLYLFKSSNSSLFAFARWTSELYLWNYL